MTIAESAIFFTCAFVLGVELRWQAWAIGFKERCEHQYALLEEGTQRARAAAAALERAAAASAEAVAEIKESLK